MASQCTSHVQGTSSLKNCRYGCGRNNERILLKLVKDFSGRWEVQISLVLVLSVDSNFCLMLKIFSYVVTMDNLPHNIWLNKWAVVSHWVLSPSNHCSLYVLQITSSPKQWSVDLDRRSFTPGNPNEQCREWRTSEGHQLRRVWG